MNTPTTEQQLKPDQIRDGLIQFYGTEHYYKTNQFVPDLQHTDGIQWLCIKAQCHWILDIIASVQRNGPRLCQEEFQSWILTVDLEQSTALIICTDGGAGPSGEHRELYRQKIPYTDFPLKEIKLWVRGSYTARRYHTIMLPSEY